MISNAIELIGTKNIKYIRAELADTNKNAFEVVFKQNGNAVEAVQSTPLGKALRDIGYGKVEARNDYPYPRAEFYKD